MVASMGVSATIQSSNSRKPRIAVFTSSLGRLSAIFVISGPASGSNSRASARRTDISDVAGLGGAAEPIIPIIM